MQRKYVQLALVALVIAIVVLVQSAGRSLIGYAVPALALLHLLPV